jgi:hypothetical protein
MFLPRGDGTMTPFKNSVKLRGFLGEDAAAPSSDIISRYSYGSLTLCIDAGLWNKVENLWVPRTIFLPLICIGPYFCGYTRGLKRGDHVEVEGELCASESGTHVRVLQLNRIERPLSDPDDSDDG